MDKRLNIDNCPFPLTKCPEGWKARRDNLKRRDCLYSKSIEYENWIYWNEGWSLCNAMIKKIEMEK